MMVVKVGGHDEGRHDGGDDDNKKVVARVCGMVVIIMTRRW